MIQPAVKYKVIELYESSYRAAYRPQPKIARPQWYNCGLARAFSCETAEGLRDRRIDFLVQISVLLSDVRINPTFG